ncbi:MAG: hypothetical protein ACUVWP_02715 [bacterium]
MRDRVLYKNIHLIFGLSLLLLVQTSFSLKLNNIDAISNKESTTLVITFDKSFNYYIKSIPGELVIIVDGVGKVKCAKPELKDNFISEVKIEKENKMLKINIITTKKSKRFVSYKSNDSKVLYVVIKAELEENIMAEINKEYENLRILKCLVIDDDDGYNNGNIEGGIDVDEHYTKIFNELNLGWEKIRIMHNAKSISNIDLSGYNLVIWLTGLNAIPETISIEKLKKISNFISNGGKIIIISQNLFSDSPSDVKRYFKELLNLDRIDNDTRIDSIIYLPYSNEPRTLSLNNPTSPVGNWGDGMVISDSTVLKDGVILKGGDNKCYGIASKRARVGLFTIEVANIDSPYTRLDILKSAIDVLMNN